MKYREFAPPPALASYVRCVWTLQGEPDANAGADPVVPDGCVEIVLNFGDRFLRYHDNGDVERQPRALIAGQLTRAITIAPEGVIDLVGVRFHPWGAAPVLRMSGGELRDRMFALDETIAPDRLFERVGDCSTAESRVETAFSALGEIVRRAKPPRYAAPRAAAMVAAGRTLSVRALASELGTSTRTVQQLFRDDIGMPPKSLMRLTRLQRAVALARGAPTRSLSRVALDAGYYDHAHLARDCREIVGVTPSELLGGASPLTDVFLDRGAA